jgi:anaerobic selenocysteine-containing dehydrogenase
MVHEQFFIDTTSYADIPPATTFLEKDLNKAYGHTYLQISNQSIDPLVKAGPTRCSVSWRNAWASPMTASEQTTDDVDRRNAGEIGEPADSEWLGAVDDGMTRERLEKEGHGRFRATGHFYRSPKVACYRQRKAELRERKALRPRKDPQPSYLRRNRAFQKRQRSSLELLSQSR